VADRFAPWRSAKCRAARQYRDQMQRLPAGKCHCCTLPKRPQISTEFEQARLPYRRRTFPRIRLDIRLWHHPGWLGSTCHRPKTPTATGRKFRGASVYLPVPIVPKDQLINERIGRSTIMSLLNLGSSAPTTFHSATVPTLFFPALQLDDRRSPHATYVYCFGERGCRRTGYAALVTILTNRDTGPIESARLPAAPQSHQPYNTKIQVPDTQASSLPRSRLPRSRLFATPS
jgi:hypothetical protein